MNLLSKSLVAAMGLALSACGSLEVASRNAPLDLSAVAPVAAQYAIAGYSVNVPRSLRVSEANRYYPGGDIVWRGDAPGDRYAQVAALFEQGLEMSRGLTGGGRPVQIEIEVERFHGITEKARYTTGGVHAITFLMTLRDPETGAPLAPARRVRADLEALGGDRAIAADRAGQTQKVRITQHLARVFATELTDPEGYRGANLGFYQLLNKL